MAVEVAERFAQREASESELARAFTSMTKIPVGEGFINVPSPRWFTPEPSEPMPEYRGEPGDHGAMAAASMVCAPDARTSASGGSRFAADAVVEVAWSRADVDWRDFPEAHRQAEAIREAARAAERREQAAILRRIIGRYPPPGTAELAS